MLSCVLACLLACALGGHQARLDAIAPRSTSMLGVHAIAAACRSTAVLISLHIIRHSKHNVHAGKIARSRFHGL